MDAITVSVDDVIEVAGPRWRRVFRSSRAANRQASNRTIGLN